MNINYVGSVAQRFMQFRSSLQDTTEETTNLFNAVSIYIPASLASANIVDYDGTNLTAETPIVKTVTLDNYKDVMQGELLTQWAPVFNDGTNNSVIIYLVVFFDTGFAPTVTASTIVWAPLKTAFDMLYHISFFKVMFSEHYDGSAVAEGDNTYDDSNYFDMCLCLAYLCELETTLSMFLCEVHLDLSLIGETDTNACWILSKTRAEETAFATTLVGSTVATRAEYFWGFVLLLGGARTEILVHNGNYVEPIRLGVWFNEENASGQFVGNKLAKIRLTSSRIKPTGLPSILNSDVNDNLPSNQYEILDAKHVGYLISIADGSDANAEIVRDRTVSNFPVNAWNIAKWIDYTCSQTLANYASKVESLTEPVLANEETYEYIKTLVTNTIQAMTSTNRLEKINIKFPSFEKAKVDANSFEGTAVWSAYYVDDLESVFISGNISF
jgi:hypothetical protein